MTSLPMCVGGGWDVTAFGDRAPSRFEAVVFAGSVAEVCTTHGDLTALVGPHRRRLQAVQYTRTCCAAMVLPGAGPAAEAARRFFGAHRSRPGAAGGDCPGPPGRLNALSVSRSKPLHDAFVRVRWALNQRSFSVVLGPGSEGAGAAARRGRRAPHGGGRLDGALRPGREGPPRDAPPVGAGTRTPEGCCRCYEVAASYE